MRDKSLTIKPWQLAVAATLGAVAVFFLLKLIAVLLPLLALAAVAAIAVLAFSRLRRR